MFAKLQRLHCFKALNIQHRPRILEKKLERFIISARFCLPPGRSNLYMFALIFLNFNFDVLKMEQHISGSNYSGSPIFASSFLSCFFSCIFSFLVYFDRRADVQYREFLVYLIEVNFFHFYFTCGDINL